MRQKKPIFKWPKQGNSPEEVKKRKEMIQHAMNNGFLHKSLLMRGFIDMSVFK